MHPQSAAPGTPGEAKRNLTDPDSRIMPTRHGWVQGYNCQLVVSSDYLILAADLHNRPGDVTSYQPVIDQAAQAARAIRRATGRRSRIGTVLADAGYASTTNLTCPGPDRLIALGTRHHHHTAARDNPAHGQPPHDATPWQRMHHRLRTPAGAARYRHRAAIVEPVHAHLKDRRALRAFARRGLTAARSEFRFAAAVTNLLRLRTALANTATSSTTESQPPPAPTRSQLRNRLYLASSPRSPMGRRSDREGLGCVAGGGVSRKPTRFGIVDGKIRPEGDLLDIGDPGPAQPVVEVRRLEVHAELRSAVVAIHGAGVDDDGRLAINQTGVPGVDIESKDQAGLTDDVDKLLEDVRNAVIHIGTLKR